MSSAGYDRQISIFSPEGRLYQIEYALKAVRNDGLTSVGIRGKDSVVVASQRKIPETLVDGSTVTRVFRISKNVGCVAAGVQPDAVALVERARSEAQKFAHKNGYEMPAGVLARRMADLAQVYTQHAYMRPLACSLMMISIDDETGPQLFKCDPAGSVLGYRACAAGAKEVELTNFLEKKLKSRPDLSLDDAIKLALSSLQTVLGELFQPSEVELAHVSATLPNFSKLSEDDILAHLTEIAEKD